MVVACSTLRFADDWLDELEPTLTVAREHDRVTVGGVGEADERVVGKRRRKAAREVESASPIDRCCW
jgi:hypothetical protein